MLKKLKRMKERILSLVLIFVMVVSLFAGLTPVEVHAAEPANYNFTDIKLDDIIYPGDTILNNTGYSGSLYVRVMDRNYIHETGETTNQSTITIQNSYIADECEEYTITSDAWKVVMVNSNYLYLIKVDDANWVELIDEELIGVSKTEGSDTNTVKINREEDCRYFYQMQDAYEMSYPDRPYTNEMINDIVANSNSDISGELQRTMSLEMIESALVEITGDSFCVNSSVFGMIYKFEKDTDVEGKTDNYLHTGAVTFASEKIARDVTLLDAEHGTITATSNGITATKVEEVETVNLTLTPDEGYEIGTVSVKDAEDNEISVKEDYSFIMPRSAVTISATFTKPEEPATCTVTIDSTNYDHENGYLIGWGVDINGDQVVFNGSDTSIVVAKGSTVTINSENIDFKIAVEGAEATVSEMQYGGETDSTRYYDISNISGDIKIVINPEENGSGDGDGTGEESTIAIYDTTDIKLFNPRYTYNEETSAFTIKLEAPAEGYEYRYYEMYAYSDFRDKALIDTYNNSTNQYEEGCEKKINNFRNSTKVENNSFTVSANTLVFLYYCQTGATGYNLTSMKSLIFLTQEDGTVYGGADRNGIEFSLNVDTNRLSEIYDENGLIKKPMSYSDFVDLENILKEAINISEDAPCYVAREGISNYTQDYREGFNPNNVGSYMTQYDSIHPGFELYYLIRLGGPLGENYSVEEQDKFYVKVKKGTYLNEYYLCYYLGKVGGEVVEVDTFNVDFDWEMLPTINVGSQMTSFSSSLAEVSGEGIDPTKNFKLYIKADESFLIEKGQTNPRYDQAKIDSLSDSMINTINNIINKGINEYEGWIDPYYLYYGLGYTINAQDTYGAYCYLNTELGSDTHDIGYWFGECDENRRYQGTINCEVPYTTYMVYISRVEVIFELGTLAEMAQKKDPSAAPATYTVTFDKTGYPEKDCWASGSGVNNDYIKFEEHGDQATVVADSSVWVFANEEFTVTAEGATIVIPVRQNTEEGAGGYEALISEFTADTTIVVSKITNDPEPPVHTHTFTEVPAKAATCTTDGNNKYYKCDCGKFFKEDKTTETTVAAETILASHSWVTDAWEKDATNHWHKCNNCTEVKDKAAHVDANTDNKCDDCEYVMTTSEPPAHTHSLTKVAEKAATCTTAGSKAYYTCSGCDSLYADAEGTTVTTLETVTVKALGHDWSGEWTIIKQATESEEGKQETLCTRNCGHKKVVVIPKLGVVDTNSNLEKDVEVAPEAPIREAVLQNSKEDLVAASNIFTPEEKAEIAKGKDARVWVEVTKTNESTIAAKDKEKIEIEAEKIMGENAKVTYFDADLFKQIEGSDKLPISEPGIFIEISVKLPEELLNRDKSMVREYKIIRLHKNEAQESSIDVITGEFREDTGELVFKSEKFSTFAISYNDVPRVTEENTPDNSTTPDNTPDTTVTYAPKTGDTANVALWMLVLMSAVLGLVQMYTKKKVH